MRIQRTDLTAPLDIEFTGAFGERPAVYSFTAQPDQPDVFAADVTDPIVIKRLLSLDGFALIDVEAASDQTVWDVAIALEVISAQLGRTVTLHDLHEAFDVPWPEPTPEVLTVDLAAPKQPEPILAGSPLGELVNQPGVLAGVQSGGPNEALDSEGGTDDDEAEDAPTVADAATGEKLVDEAREARAIAPEVREPLTLAEGRSAYKVMFGKAASPRFTFQQIKEALAKGPGSQE